MADKGGAEPVVLLPQELHPFVKLVLGDPALQQRLGAEFDVDAFVAAAAAVAADHAIPLDLEVLSSVLRPDPLGLGRFSAAPITLERWPPEGWLPTYSVPSAGPPLFDWLWFGARQLTSSFFEDEARIASALPLNWLLRIRTGLDALIAGAASEPVAPLQGLIFHMSRCGSTLIAQMLGAVPGTIVASEPTPLDAILLWAWRDQLSPAEANPAIRAMVAALGRRRGTAAQRLFIKTDAWHTILLPLLRAAFPEVPWLYLFRDPLEVVVSHQTMPGIQTVAGIMPEALFGIEDGIGMPPLDYTSRVFDAIGRAAIAHRSLGGGLFVEYPDLVRAAPTLIAAHFGLDLNRDDLAAMAATARRDSKAPDFAFEPDSAVKRARASAPAIAAARVLDQTYRQLAGLARQDSDPAATAGFGQLPSVDGGL